MDKKIILNEILFVLGVFLLALTYNLFFLPNDLVIGGTTGLAVILKDVFNPTVFIYVATFALLIISFIFLGFDVSKNTIVGSIMYPIFVSLSKPVSDLLANHLIFDEFVITILLASLFYGLSNGIIFRTGYTTGGFDVIANIITKYFKIPQGKALFIANSIVIFLGGYVFGFSKMVYALLILYIGSTITNKLVIGISESKMFFIYTRNTEKVKDLIVKELKSGYTILPTVGGYSHNKSEMIMCVLQTRDYYHLKELVLSADENAFIVVNDCYDVNGGVQKGFFPFSM